MVIVFFFLNLFFAFNIGGFIRKRIGREKKKTDFRTIILRIRGDSERIDNCLSSGVREGRDNPPVAPPPLIT